ncbi:MAG: hypothetical protein Q9221_007117 [Calogaya cf. arnoldii]
MFTDTLNAVFTAATVALIFLLANVFQKEIALFFAKPIPGIPEQAFNNTRPGRTIANPLGDLITKTWDGRLLLAVNPLPLPTAYDAPFSLGALLTIKPLPTSSMPLPLARPTRTRSVVPPSASISSKASISTAIRSKPPLPTTTQSQSASSTSTQSEVPSPIPDPTKDIPHSPGIDEYHLYTGNGSIAAGWPHKSDWVSFSEMFTTNIPLIIHSCTLFHVPPNTLPEILSIHTAILAISAATNTDPRFILAIILQESNGCVRVPTSFYSLRNPGLMQSHNGPATCNEDASPIYPCPYSLIEEMIREGTAGTFEGRGMGLVMALREATNNGEVNDVGRFYRAARIYNSGSLDASGDLGKGVATHCYASDVANRLRGWSLGEDGCVEGSVSVVGGNPEGREVRVGLMGVGFVRGE